MGGKQSWLGDIESRGQLFNQSFYIVQRFILSFLLKYFRGSVSLLKKNKTKTKCEKRPLHILIEQQPRPMQILLKFQTMCENVNQVSTIVA